MKFALVCIMALGIKHGLNHKGKIGLSTGVNNCMIAEPWMVWKHFHNHQKNPTEDSPHSTGAVWGHFKATFSSLVSLLIELAAPTLQSVSTPPQRIKRMSHLHHWKRCQLPHPMADWENLPLNCTKFTTEATDSEGKQPRSIKHSTAHQQLFPRGPLSAPPTPPPTPPPLKNTL